MFHVIFLWGIFMILLELHSCSVISARYNDLCVCSLEVGGWWNGRLNRLVGFVSLYAAAFYNYSASLCSLVFCCILAVQSTNELSTRYLSQRAPTQNRYYSGLCHNDGWKNSSFWGNAQQCSAQKFKRASGSFRGSGPHTDFKIDGCTLYMWLI